MIPNFYECEYCSATFVKQENLEKHNCRYKKRFNHITNDRKGITAYNLYKKWLNLQGRSTKYVDKHTFIHSVQYNHFTKFADYIKKNSLPSTKEFMKLMIKSQISPQNWTNEYTMEFFLEEYDLKGSPITHIDVSVDTIVRISDALECDPPEIFLLLDVKDISVLIRTRKLSPWLLLNSKVFKAYLRSRASAHDRQYFQKIINPKKWREIINDNPKIKKAVETIIEEFGL